MSLEGADGVFGDVTAMEIREHELEFCPPLVFDVELVVCTALIVKDLEVDNMTAFSDSGHDLICGGKAVAVVEGFEWFYQDDIGVHMVLENEEVFAAAGANREPAHVISIKFTDGIGRYVELL